MRRSLIIGMGIGQLYKTVLNNLGHEIVTVDSNFEKNADFTNLNDVLQKNLRFDTVHICTPNFTHEFIAEQIAKSAKIVFIEKPGLKNSSCWHNLCLRYPSTHFMLVKNNMWRDNIAQLQNFAKIATTVDINWVNKDRVPNPGSWFTTKELAFGGVSRDLMPHLLSFYIALNPNWKLDPISKIETLSEWKLSDLHTSDYGTVNQYGVYDVDDSCFFNFGTKWKLVSKWRSLNEDQRNITFTMPNNDKEIVELGLCPEYAYQNMIVDAINHIDDLNYWNDQYVYDMWIHQKIENL